MRDRTESPLIGPAHLNNCCAVVMTELPSDPLTLAHSTFLKAAVVPRDTSHASGSLEQARAILAAHPELARHDIHAAAVLGDDDGVRRWLQRDASAATAQGGPYGWDALTHLCFSRYLRLDGAQTPGFERAARALLEAGASANTGFFEQEHAPTPEWESVLYGAVGIAHHPGVTRVLLDYGADPNAEEVPYHAPEGWDNAAFEILLTSPALTADSLSMMLLRKSDWHDLEGMHLLLDRGADPNRKGRWGKTPLDHALRSDNDLAIIELLLDRGADPSIRSHDIGVTAKAARHGRGDVLALLEHRRLADPLDGRDALVRACAMGDAATVRTLVDQQPEAVRAVVASGADLLIAFARVGNRDGVEQLLAVGIAADVRVETGEGYFDIAPRSTALHVAAWRGWPAVVELLVKSGVDVNAVDGMRRTPLQLAVRACVDSYWTDRRTPQSVRTLLDAGASIDGIRLPTGYGAIDALLRAPR